MKYSKNSIIGRIYKWYHGYYANSNSCDVRKTMMLAPLKLLVNPRFPNGEEYPLWFLWVDIYAVWSVSNYGWMWTTDTTSVGLGKFVLVLLFLMSQFASVVLFGGQIVFLGLAILERLGDFLRPKMPKVHIRVPRFPSVSGTKEIIADWWDDIYHKVCKPVEWVD